MTPSDLLPPPLAAPVRAIFSPSWGQPSDAQCLAWWDRYGVPEHIRDHSRLVAEVATTLAQRALAMGHAVQLATVRGSALLHDLAKDYTIRHGGSHAQLGAAWAMELTGNPLLAMGVAHHVWWPYELDLDRFFMPIAVIYADKRARHTELVTIEERFEDLVVRYGQMPEVARKIRLNLVQTQELERRLAAFLQEDIHACLAHCRRLVQ